MSNSEASRLDEQDLVSLFSKHDFRHWPTQTSIVERCLVLSVGFQLVSPCGHGWAILKTPSAADSLPLRTCRDELTPSHSLPMNIRGVPRLTESLVPRIRLDGSRQSEPAERCAVGTAPPKRKRKRLILARHRQITLPRHQPEVPNRRIALEPSLTKPRGREMSTMRRWRRY